MSEEFNTGSGCVAAGAGGWCVSADDCVGACEYDTSGQISPPTFATGGIVLGPVARLLAGDDYVAAPTSERLRQTQQALAASQADLTRVTGERHELRMLLTDAVQDLAEYRIELKAARHDAEHLATERDLGRAELASATAELEQLRAARTWQVARNDDTPCAVCRRQIRRGEGFEPLADATGFFQHVLCPDPEEKPDA